MTDPAAPQPETEQPAPEAAAAPAVDGTGEAEPQEKPRAKLSPEKARQALEAVLFAADQPLAPVRLAQILGRSFDAKDVRRMVDELNAEYQAQGRAFEIVEIAGGLQFMTRGEFRQWVAEAHKHRRQEKLTPSSVETLAIVAYKQPILRVQVDDIRGVQCGPILRNLQERGLVKAVGRQNVPGRPILYGTSRIFLQHFGLKSLKDLPRVAELTPP